MVTFQHVAGMLLIHQLIGLMKSRLLNKTWYPSFLQCLQVHKVHGCNVALKDPVDRWLNRAARKIAKVNSSMFDLYAFSGRCSPHM